MKAGITVKRPSGTVSFILFRSESMNWTKINGV